MNLEERRAKRAEKIATTETKAEAVAVPTASENSTHEGLNLVRASDVVTEPISWLWEGWLAAGKVHILGGSPGTGKTTVALSIAATVTTGGRWPDESRCGAPGNVLVWSGEDTASDVLVPRLEAAGADCSRVYFLGDVGTGPEAVPFDPALHMILIEERLAAIGGARLFVVDPIVSAVTGDSHKNTETRRALQPFVEMASRFGCAVLGITHLSKGTQGRDPTERLSGSIAFGAVARVVLIAAKCKDSTESGSGRILVRTKSNIGPDGGGFGYDLETDTQTSREGVTASRAVWGAPLVGPAYTLIGEAETTPEEERKDGRRARSAPAREWLAGLVAVTPMESRDILAKGEEEEGFSDKQLRRARESLGLRVRSEGFGKNRTTWWGFPDRPGEVA